MDLTLCAEQIINGDASLFMQILLSTSEKESFLHDLFAILCDKNYFDVDFFLEKILYTVNDISFIKDDNLARKLISLGGSKALVFINNPSEEIVSLAGYFRIDDYSFYDGSYKDSSFLLLKFLEEDKFTALNYTHAKAIDKRVYEYISNNKTDFIDSITNYKELGKSYYFNKYLTSLGSYVHVCEIDDVFFNIDSFDLLYNTLNMQYADPGVTSYKNTSFKNIINKRFEIFSTDVSYEVANRIIDLGYSIDNYFNYDNFYSRGIARALFNRGYKEVIFKTGQPLDFFTEEEYAKVSFVEYLDYKAKYGYNVSIPPKMAMDFIRYGYVQNLEVFYDVIDEEFLTYLGLNNISIDEYNKLLPIYKGIPLLKAKFTNDLDNFADYLYLFPTKEIINRYVSVYPDISLQELNNDLDDAGENVKFSNDLICYFLKRKDYELICNRIDYECFDEEFAHRLYDIAKNDGFCLSILKNNMPNTYYNRIINIAYDDNNYDFFFGGISLDDVIVDKLIRDDVDSKFVRRYMIFNEKLFLNIILNKGFDDNLFDIIYNINLLNSIKGIEFLYKLYKIGVSDLHLLGSNLMYDNKEVISYICEYVDPKDTEFLEIINFYGCYLDENPLIFDKFCVSLDDETIIKYVKDSSTFMKKHIVTKMIKLHKFSFLSLFNGGDEINDYFHLALENGLTYDDILSLNVSDQVYSYFILNGHPEAFEKLINYNEYLLKRTLLSGYFPYINSSIPLIEDLKKLGFTDEERKLLLGYVKDNVLYISLLPELYSDIEGVCDALSHNAFLYLLLPEKIQFNDDVLLYLYENCYIYFESIMKLVNVPLDVKYRLIERKGKAITDFDLVDDIKAVSLAISTFPNVIGMTKLNLSSNDIKRAFNSGFVFAKKFVNDKILIEAYKEGIDVPRNIILSLDLAQFKKYCNFLFKNDKCLDINLVEEYINANYFGDIGNYERVLFALNYIFDEDLLIDDEERKKIFHEFLIFEDDYVASSSEVTYLKERIDVLSSFFDELFDYADNILYVFNNEDRKEIVLNNYFNHYILLKYISKDMLNEDEITHLLDDLYLLINDENCVFVINWLHRNGFENMVQEFIRQHGHDKIDELFPLMKISDIKDLDWFEDVSYKTIDFICSSPALFNNDQIILDLLNKGYIQIYTKLGDRKAKKEFIEALIEVSPDDISLVPVEIDGWIGYVEKALSNGANLELLLNHEPSLKTNKELFELVQTHAIEDILLFSTDLWDEELINSIPIGEICSFSALGVEEIKKYIDFLNIDRVYEAQTIDIINYAKSFVDCLILNSDDLGDYFANDKLIVLYNLLFEDKYYDLLKVSNDLFADKLSTEYKKIYKDGKLLLKYRGKINTLDQNFLFTYEFVQKVYPVLGLEYSLDLLEYNSFVIENIIDLIDEGKKDTLVYLLKLNEEYKFFDDGNKNIHYLCRHINESLDLIDDIYVKNFKLGNEDVLNLRTILRSGNYLDIKNVQELKKYIMILNDKIDKLKTENDLYAIKGFIAYNYGFDSFNTFVSSLKGYGLFNFVNYNSVLKSVIDKHGKDYVKDYMLTKEEVSYLMAIKKFDDLGEYDQIMGLFDLYKERLNSENFISFDYLYDSLIRKTRWLYNVSIRDNMSNVDDLKERLVGRFDGVNVYSIDDKRFNFLIHAVKGYDFCDYPKMIAEDPSLWFKLEGSSTISTSTISDNGFYYTKNDDLKDSKVFYLINDFPDDFLLYMCDCDLFIEHGFLNFDPNADDNGFTTFEGLKQRTATGFIPWNEVAGNRKGVIPCAIFCESPVPNKDSIRAAKFFSEYLGKEVPIFCANPDRQPMLKERFNETLQRFNEHPTIEDLHDLFYNGLNLNSLDDLKINYFGDVLKLAIGAINNNLYKGVISYKEFVVFMNEIYKIIYSTNYGKIDEYNYAFNKYYKTYFFLCSQYSEELNNIKLIDSVDSMDVLELHRNDKDYLVSSYMLNDEEDEHKSKILYYKVINKLESLLNPDGVINSRVLKSNAMEVLVKDKVIPKEGYETFVDDVLYNYYGKVYNNDNALKIDLSILNQFLKEFVIDYLICNDSLSSSDCVIDDNYTLKVLNRNNAFCDIPKHLKLGVSGMFDTSNINIYYVLFEAYKQGLIDLDFGFMKEVLSRLELITDEEYASLFDGLADVVNTSLPVFKNMMIKRKNQAITNLNKFITSLEDIKSNKNNSLY